MRVQLKQATLTVQTRQHPKEPSLIRLTFNYKRINSVIISKAQVKEHNCFTTLQVRRSNHMYLCNAALLTSMEDWTTHIGDRHAHVFPATKNEVVGNWVALVMPEAVPIRLGLMTHAAHLIFLHEDIEQASVSGKFDTELYSEIVDELKTALPRIRDTESGSPCDDKGHDSTKFTPPPIHRILNPLIKALFSVDHHTATEVVAAWRKHYATLHPASADKITSLNAYITSRVHIAATGVWLVMLHYALDIHLSQSSLKAVDHITTAAMKSVALTTDYWSWPKQSCSASNNLRAMNAVPFAMAEFGVGEMEAREKVKELALEAEGEFSKLKKAFGGIAAGSRETAEIATYLDAVEAFTAGHSLWCSTCPRYHGLI